MTKQTVGFIGFGNMAQAMAKGFLHSGALSGGEIFACAKRWEKLEAAAGQLGIVPCRDSLEVADQADILILAVKPYFDRGGSSASCRKAGGQGTALRGGGLAV